MLIKKLLFISSAPSSSSGDEALWITDGTAEGTRKLHDPYPGLGTPFISNISAGGEGTAFFAADDGDHGKELWFTNGTLGNTQLLKDINPGSDLSWPNGFISLGNGQTLFRAQNSAHGLECWISDGTVDGTYLLKDINPGAANGGGPVLSLGNGSALLVANDGVNGTALWITDGTANGTSMLVDIHPGTGANDLPEYGVMSRFVLLAPGIALFEADDGSNGRELWVTDGTAQGTQILTDLDSNLPSRPIGQPAALGNGLAVFTASAVDGVTKLWVTDGTAQGTAAILNGGGYGFCPIGNGKAVFAGNNGIDGYELWITDGTSAGTFQVKNIEPGSTADFGGNSSLTWTNFCAMGDGRALFSATTSAEGVGLWITDGTSSGTYLLKDIEAGNFSGSIQQITAIGNGLFAFAARANNLDQVWITDGTTQGTRAISDQTVSTNGFSKWFIPILVDTDKTGTSGNDTLLGDWDPNKLYGLDGNDTLHGKDGTDTLDGGSGNDILFGGKGNNTLIGGAGADTLNYSDQTQGVSINLATTLVQKINSSTYDQLSGIENIVGTSYNDALSGSTANNLLRSGLGNDVLVGKGGSDTLIGGLGNDTYEIDRSDTLIEFEKQGIDTIRVAYTYTLGSVFENLSLSGSAAINGTGNTKNNVLTGNLAANTLIGKMGNDILDGGSGGDKLIGGTGNDTYLISDKDTAVEAASEGYDTIKTSISLTLPKNIEALVLTGLNHLSGTGNAAANKLYGNSGFNRLDGGLGADTLAGGLGNDAYTLRDADKVIELVNQGRDTVISHLKTYTLGIHVENLTLAGTKNTEGLGNSSDNTITGNSGDNTLSGRDGDDTLRGESGDDLLIGGTGYNMLTGGSGKDSFRFDVTPISNTNKMIITDFSSRDDEIQLKKSHFYGLEEGSLSTENFTVNNTGKATQSSHHIIYEKDTGLLYYDFDGAGGYQAIPFALIGLNKHANISADDIVVY